jgi:hypothetical protein
MSESQKRCEKCFYWAKRSTSDTENVDATLQRGECRVFPPTADTRDGLRPEFQNVRVWPITMASDWCGSFCGYIGIPPVAKEPPDVQPKGWFK